MNDKIGKHGDNGFRPKETLMGRPIGRKSQILITRSLGNDYYVVIDPGIIVDVEERIDVVRKGLPNEPKRAKRVNTPDS